MTSKHRSVVLNLIIVALLSTYTTSHNINNISTCIELKSALLSNITTLELSQNVISCSQYDFQEPINIKRNITIIGNNKNNNVSMIDWTDSQGVVNIERGHELKFVDMLMIQNNGILNYQMEFMNLGNNTKCYYINTIMVSRSCHQDINMSKDSLHLKESNIHIGNVSLHFCNTYFECDGGGGDAIVEDSFETQFSVEYSNIIENNIPEEKCFPNVEDNYTVSSRISPKVYIFSLIIIIICTLSIICVCLYFIYNNINNKKIADTKPKSNLRSLSIQSLSFSSPMTVSAPETAVSNNRDVPVTTIQSQLSNNAKLQYKITSLQQESAIMMLCNDSDISVGSKLGRGSFGTVYKARWQGLQVAMKVLLYKCTGSYSEPLEASLCRKVSHPNIVQTYTVKTRRLLCGSSSKFMPNGRPVSAPPNQRELALVMSSRDVFSEIATEQSILQGANIYETWIISEFCDGGSLSNLIQTGIFMESKNMIKALLTALDIARALKYLHSIGIIHGDIKTENILIKKDSTNEKGYMCKVGDFGVSKLLLKGQTYIETYNSGTITHMPPEMLKKGILTKATDIYSFGILLWEMLSSEKPYNNLSNGEIMLNVADKKMRPKIPEHFPECYSKIIEACWIEDYVERPDISTIIDRILDLLKEEKEILSMTTDESYFTLKNIESDATNSSLSTSLYNGEQVKAMQEEHKKEIVTFSSSNKDSIEWTVDGANTLKDTELEILINEDDNALHNSHYMPFQFSDVESSMQEITSEFINNPCFMMSSFKKDMLQQTITDIDHEFKFQSTN